jgi:GNAT superfamily N-acetyltransferase
MSDLRFSIRPATMEDARLLTDMLVEAANWHPERRRSRDVTLADPAVSHYVAGWPRAGDIGSVAVAADGSTIGACWLRLLTAADPGYGFVGTGVPELTLGVNAAWRSRGVGRALVQAVVAQAREAGFARISLSCERGNFAIQLYRDEGFVTVESGPDADTMVRTLN